MDNAASGSRISWLFINRMKITNITFKGGEEVCHMIYADDYPIIADTHRNFVGTVRVNYTLLCAARTNNLADATS